MNQSEAIIAGLALVCASIAVYFLPTFVAYKRDHPQYTPILVLNFFLGWSLIGWVAALVWALTSSTYSTTQSHTDNGSAIPLPTGGGIIPSRTLEKACPMCAETVKAAARVCRFCGHQFEASAPLALPATQTPAHFLEKDDYRGFKFSRLSDYSVVATIEGAEGKWENTMAFRDYVDELLSSKQK